MARSPEDLANLALSYLVRGTIRSLDGTEPEAVQTKQHMNFAKESVIEEYDWPECRVIAPLTAVNVDEGRGWTYIYNEPSDLVHLWRITDGTNSDNIIKYERGMSSDVSSDRAYIFTDQAGAYARYGSSRVSISRLSPGVFDLVAIKLAIVCCLPLTKETKLQTNLINYYGRQVNKVKTIVANSEPEIVDQDFVPDDIQVRYT